VHVECRGSGPRGRTQVFTPNDFNRPLEKPSDREQRGEKVRSPSPVPSTRYTKGAWSVETSDTSDIPGPIPLTGARLGETGGGLDPCFVQLGPRRRTAHAVLQVNVVLMLEVSRTLQGMKLIVHEEEQ
jgi:hypothetical protein